MSTTEMFMKQIDSLINRHLSLEKVDSRTLMDLFDIKKGLENKIETKKSRQSYLKNYNPPTKLREMVREVLLQEYRMDKDIEDKIDEFGELSDQMDRIKRELSKIKNKYSTLEDELRPVLDNLEEHRQKSLKTEKYLVTIKRKGYTRESYKYKQSFERSLTKVNKQTRKLLEDLLQSTKSTSRVLSSVGVQRLGESSFLSKVVSKIKGFFKTVFRSLRKTDKELDTLQNISHKMVRK